MARLFEKNNLRQPCLHARRSASLDTDRNEVALKKRPSRVGIECACRAYPSLEGMKMNVTLPIAGYYDEIASKIQGNPVVIIQAETGAGKSTQVPQMLLDFGYKILVTQPRRLAASSVAERVAQEWGTELGQIVGYRIANERCDSPNTQCLFCTDGLALVRELLGHNDIDVLVIDEVHEWNLNIEVLAAWVKHELATGRKLKVVLMSATIEVEKLSAYFNNAPVVSVPGRTFPVTELPRQTSHITHIANLVRQGHNVLVFEPGKEEIRETIEALKSLGLSAEMLPLHGELTSAEQARCFRSYKRNKVIVSTNVAQTSVTIADIDVVVDTGMERRVETVNGVEGIYLRAISMADRSQRKGRAGRTKPGFYTDYCDEPTRPAFPDAEIMRLRLDQVVLRLAVTGFDAEELTFFHQPDVKKIHEAKEVLVALGCLTPTGNVTPTGHTVARFPVSVRVGRMIAEAVRCGVLEEVITIAAILEGGELHMRKDEYGFPVSSWRRLVHTEHESDVFAQIILFKSACKMSNTEMKANGINIKTFSRVRQIRRQISDTLWGKVQWSKNSDRKLVHRCIVAGLVDHLFHAESFGNYKNGDDVERMLSNSSVVSPEPKWLVGIPRDFEFKNARGGKNTLRVVTFATKATPELVMELAPHLVKHLTGVRPRFDAILGDVVTSNVMQIGKVAVSEEKVITTDLPNYREILREGLFLAFRMNPDAWPLHMRYGSSVLTTTMSVPEVSEVCFGVNPNDGERFMAYGTKRLYYEWSMLLETFWTLDRNEAEEARKAILSRVPVQQKSAPAQVRATVPMKLVVEKPQAQPVVTEENTSGVSLESLRETFGDRVGALKKSKKG